MKRIIRQCFIAVGILVAIGAWYVFQFGYLVSDLSALHSPGGNKQIPQVDLINRGAYLIRVANCGGCHTALGGAAFAGGRIIPTQFGQFVAPNITPDVQTGIGSWTADDFWRALHFGQSPDGRLLYPAFPYPSYTLVSREDADAMFAYLQHLPAIHQPSAPHQLKFPYYLRPLLSIWRALFFRPQSYQPDPAQSTLWNRGAYLVNGLGHCSGCHGSRNMLGATINGEQLHGAVMPVVEWYAPSLVRFDEAHLGAMSEQQAHRLLTTGIADQAALTGPMADVFADSLQYYSQADVDALVSYLRSLPATAMANIDQTNNDTVPMTVKPEVMARWMAQGEALYKTHCADCHGTSGQGVSNIYPALAHNNAVQMTNIANPIRLILYGGFPPTSIRNPRPYGMPPYGPVLSDDEVALVLTYIRHSWGNHGDAVSSATVNHYRNAPVN